ncbi:hypothetical protein KJ590_01510 [Patescibacteria group bacterium]|nr:hypothetical protein [Patescibacteria group bacterium]
MTSPNQALLAPLIYYDLLMRPLTALEIFKYLRAGGPEISFFDAWRELKAAKPLKDLVQQKNGLYFLSGRENLIVIRQKRLKLAQLKWKKVKKIGQYLALVPFLRLVAITGSLTSYNTTLPSDFDLLVVIKKNRLWLGRLWLTGLVGLLGQRRHGHLTQDKICLNCYLTEANLEITAQAKPRDWHAAQEYGRLTPVLEIKKGVYKNFIQANAWLADFLKNYPWPNNINAKKIRPPVIFNLIRLIFERLLNGRMGDGLEKIAGQWQNERINKKRQNEQPGLDQVFVSNACLMFHPRSKGDKLMKEFNLKMEQFN